jgi:hypothetical protein
MPTDEGYYTTYDLGTVNREDLLDVITMISPVETPFFSTVAKGKATNTLHEWPTDELAAATTNAHIEGADASGWSSNDRSRLNNRTQIFTNPFAVTTTQEEVDTAGIKSEKAYQATKKMKEHKRDIEFALFNNAAAQVAGGATTARKMGAIQGFVSGANVNGTPASPDHIVNVAAGANQKIVEDDINDALEASWDEGGAIDTVLCSAKIKRRISGFTLVDLGTAGGATLGITQNQQDLRSFNNGDRRLSKRIDIYEGDFGTVKIVPDRYIPTNTGGGSSTDVYLLEMGHWSFDFMIRPFIEDLAKLGDSLRSWVYSQGCVAGKAPKANYVFEDVLNSV